MKPLWILIVTVFAVAAHAQLPADFTPPAALTSGPWAEVPKDTPAYYNELPLARAIPNYNQQIFRAMQPMVNRRQRTRPANEYRDLRRLAERIVSDSSLSSSSTVFREVIARGLYLVSLVEAELPTATPAGREIGALIIGNSFIVANQWAQGRGRWSFAEPNYPFIQTVDQFVRLQTGPIPNAPTIATRYRLARALTHFLIWDHGRGGGNAEHVNEAWQLLQQLPEHPPGSDGEIQTAITQMEQLSIMPHAHMQENLRPFTPSTYSEERSLIRSGFHPLFSAAASCGMVICGAMNSDRELMFAKGRTNGEVQEQLIARCLESNSADGLLCRGTLTCNRQSDAPEMSYCPILTVLPEGHTINYWRQP